MAFLSVARQGQGTSASPGASGTPTECVAGTKGPSEPSSASAPAPMRVMMRRLATTYLESVTCTPSAEKGEPSGPIEKGATYLLIR